MLIMLIRVIRCLICSALLLAQSAASSRTRFTHLTRLPHFEFTNPKSIFLRSQEPWRPSGSTLVTALMADRPLKIQIESNAHDVTKMSKKKINMYLLYKCSSSSDKEFTEVPLEVPQLGKRPTTSIHCQHARTFSLVNVPNLNNTYHLTLLRNHQINFANSMTHLLELRVRANFYVGNQVSASLYIYNLDALTKTSLANNNETVTLSGVKFTKYFLTDEALKFFSTLAPPNNSSKTQKLKLFDDSFKTVFSKAPTFARFTMALSIIIRGHMNCNDPYNASAAGDLVFSNGDPDTVATEFAAKTFHSYIDLENNYLMYSPSSMATWRSYFRTSYQNKSISLCLRLSLNNPIWDYQLMLTISSDMTSNSFPIGSNPVSKDECALEKKYRWIILFEGMQDVVLFNRIMCKNLDEVAIVSFNGETCTNIISKDVTRTWQECSKVFNMSKTGRVIKFLGLISHKHSGNYRFLIRGFKFMIVVSVISLPTFNTPKNTGALPHVTYAVLDTQITLNCTVFHDGLKNVNLKPLFRIFELFRDSTSRELSLDQFAIDVLRVSPNDIIVKTTKNKATEISRGSRWLNLLLTIPHVMDRWATWVLTFTCRATVLAEDARIIGIPEYVTDTSTDVEYRGQKIFSKTPLTDAASEQTTQWTLFLAAFTFTQVAMPFLL